MSGRWIRSYSVGVLRDGRRQEKRENDWRRLTDAPRLRWRRLHPHRLMNRIRSITIWLHYYWRGDESVTVGAYRRSAGEHAMNHVRFWELRRQTLSYLYATSYRILDDKMIMAVPTDTSHLSQNLIRSSKPMSSQHIVGPHTFSSSAAYLRVLTSRYGRTSEYSSNDDKYNFSWLPNCKQYVYLNI